MFNSEYEMINDNMSDSIIGGQKEKSCINHIWVINSIIKDQLQQKSNPPIIFQQYDYQQMFDSMSLMEACADMYDMGLKNYKLQVVYKANKDVALSVKTPSGLTEERTIKQIVMQGDTWASTMASVQCDSFGKELLEDNVSFLYKYKGYVPIGILGQIDDLIGVTEAGFKAQQMNVFLNVKTANKYLQFGPNKCKSMVVASIKTKFEYLNTKLEVDTWKVSYDTEGNIKEDFNGKTAIEDVQEILYLGVVISNDGEKKHQKYPTKTK